MRKQLAVALATTALLFAGATGVMAKTQHQAVKHHKMQVTHQKVSKAKPNHISASKLSKQQIRHLQMTLNKAGFQAGHVDGRYGSSTRKAVRNFQTARHIQGKGLNQQTLSALGIQMRGAGNGQVTGVAAAPKSNMHARRPARETTGTGTASMPQQPMAPAKSGTTKKNKPTTK